MRWLLVIAALGLTALVLGALEQPGTPRPATRDPRGAPPRASATPTAPRRLTARQARAQARRDSAQTHAEQRVDEARPLLDRLPLDRDGVRIDLAGLAADDRHTVLSVDPGPRSRAHARRVYRRALQRADDTGRSYRLEWTR